MYHSVHVMSCHLQHKLRINWTKNQPNFLAVKIPYRMYSAVNTVSTIRRIMHWCNIPTKQTYDVIIMTSITLQEINYQNSHHLLFPHRLQYINHRSSFANSTSIIVMKIFQFEVYIYVYWQSLIAIAGQTCICKHYLIYAHDDRGAQSSN